MSWYSRWVERDLARWHAAGWVTEQGATAIRADLASRRSPFGAAGIFAILGAILFGFAVMSFVAAHWAEMSKLSRLLLIVGALWACYGGAAYLFSHRLDSFAQAAVLAGITVYGAGIMLIAQMYHMEGNPPDAVLYWALGALLAAMLIQSRPALGAAFVLITVWSVWERALSSTVHWGFLPVWIAALAVAVWLKWRPGLHLAAINLVVWLVPLGFLILDEHAHWLPALLGAAAALAAVAAGPPIDRNLPASLPVSHALFAYGVATAFAALFITQFLDNYSFINGANALPPSRLVPFAALTLLGLLAAMYWALQTDNRGALWIGYIAFALEIYVLYWETLGSLLNTSLFFLIAAILVSAFAWLAYLLHRRKLSSGAAA